MADVDGNATGRVQKRAQHRFVIKFLVDDVTNRAGACELEDEGIDPGDVVGQKEEPALWQVLEAEGMDAIEEFDERPPKKMERALTGGHVRHRLLRLLFTISPQASICQSTSSDGNKRPSSPRRLHRTRAAPCNQSF